MAQRCRAADAPRRGLGGVAVSRRRVSAAGRGWRPIFAHSGLRAGRGAVRACGREGANQRQHRPLRASPRPKRGGPRSPSSDARQTSLERKARHAREAARLEAAVMRTAGGVALPCLGGREHGDAEPGRFDLHVRWRDVACGSTRRPAAMFRVDARRRVRRRRTGRRTPSR